MSFYLKCVVCDKEIEGGMFCSLAHYAQYEKEKEKYEHKVYKSDGGKKDPFSSRSGWNASKHEPSIFLDGWPGEDDERDYLGVPRSRSDYSNEGIIRRLGLLAP